MEPTEQADSPFGGYPRRAIDRVHARGVQGCKSEEMGGISSDLGVHSTVANRGEGCASGPSGCGWGARQGGLGRKRPSERPPLQGGSNEIDRLAIEIVRQKASSPLIVQPVGVLEALQTGETREGKTHWTAPQSLLRAEQEPGTTKATLGYFAPIGNGKYQSGR
jgi:hypothetical protein